MGWLITLFKALGGLFAEILPSLMTEFRKPRKVIMAGESEETKAKFKEQIKKRILKQAGRTTELLDNKEYIE